MLSQDTKIIYVDEVNGSRDPSTKDLGTKDIPAGSLDLALKLIPYGVPATIYLISNIHITYDVYIDKNVFITSYDRTYARTIFFNTFAEHGNTGTYDIRNIKILNKANVHFKSIRLVNDKPLPNNAKMYSKFLTGSSCLFAFADSDVSLTLKGCSIIINKNNINQCPGFVELPYWWDYGNATIVLRDVYNYIDRNCLPYIGVCGNILNIDFKTNVQYKTYDGSRTYKPYNDELFYGLIKDITGKSLNILTNKIY
jgi:hypothetical protein